MNEALTAFEGQAVYLGGDRGADTMLMLHRLPLVKGAKPVGAGAVCLGGLRGEPATEVERQTRAVSDELIAELRAADLILIGAPMYNFGITSTLKTWFDHVLRAGETFRYTAEGPEGLLTGKRAIVIATRGGLYSDGPAAAMDSQEPHLRTMLGFIGISDVSFVRVERLAMGPEAGAAAVEAANDALRDLAARAA